MTQCNKDCLVWGVILAGGRSRRFQGGDKAFQELAGRTLIQRVVDRAGPQVRDYVISANGDPSRYADLGATAVLIDEIPGFQGPLAGLMAALQWLRARDPNARWIATFPVDGPFLPDDLVETLLRNSERDGVPAVAACGGRIHPVFGIWPVAIEECLRDYLATEKRAPISDFLASLGGLFVEFSERCPDPFLNINSREDLLQAEELAQRFDRDGDRPLNR